MDLIRFQLNTIAGHWQQLEKQWKRMENIQSLANELALKSNEKQWNVFRRIEKPWKELQRMKKHYQALESMEHTVKNTDKYIKAYKATLTHIEKQYQSIEKHWNA